MQKHPAFAVHVTAYLHWIAITTASLLEKSTIKSKRLEETLSICVVALLSALH